MTLAVPEPIGVIGIVCPDERPLLGFVSLVAPAIAMGNTVVAVPSERHPLARHRPLPGAGDLGRARAAWSTSSPARATTLAKVLAEHDDVDALWYFGSAEGGAHRRSGLGRQHEAHLDRLRPAARLAATPTQGEGREFLREATQVKNIWVPTGE